MHKIPVRFYLRKQLIGNKAVMEGKWFLYVYRNFHGTIEGVVRAYDTLGAQKKVRAMYPESEFFRNR